MKKTLLPMLLSFALFSSCDNATPNSDDFEETSVVEESTVFEEPVINTHQRMVISQTAYMWRNNYNFVFEQSEIVDSIFGKFILNKDSFLQTISEAGENFYVWFYESGGSPSIAIQMNQSDKPERADYYHVDQNTGEWKVSSFNSLSSQMCEWKTQCMNDSSSMIYVQKYEFNTSYFKNLIDGSTANNVVIENVVRSVSPLTMRYTIPATYKGEPSDNYEGFLAVDILIRMDEKEQPKAYNFARPCPKMCPEFSSEISVCPL